MIPYPAHPGSWTAGLTPGKSGSANGECHSEGRHEQRTESSAPRFVIRRRTGQSRLREVEVKFHSSERHPPPTRQVVDSLQPFDVVPPVEPSACPALTYRGDQTSGFPVPQGLRGNAHEAADDAYCEERLSEFVQGWPPRGVSP